MKNEYTVHIVIKKYLFVYLIKAWTIDKNNTLILHFKKYCMKHQIDKVEKNICNPNFNRNNEITGSCQGSLVLINSKNSDNKLPAWILVGILILENQKNGSVAMLKGVMLMSPKDNVQLIVSIKKRLIGYFIEARIINQYFLNDFSIIYFKRILRKKTIRDLEQGNQLILGNNQIFTNGFIRQEKSSVNLYVNSIELKKYKLSKRMMIGKTMSGQHRIFRKSD